MICREARVCDCTAWRRFVWTSSARKALTFSWRELHTARRGWCSPFARCGVGVAGQWGSAVGVGGSAEGMSACRG